MRGPRLTELARLAGYEAKRLVLGVRHTASIDITAACNLRCSHCYFYRDPRDIADEPSAAAWGERFRELRARGIRIVLLLGGEPALRPDVLDLADRAFPFIDVVTNGTIPIDKGFRHRLFVSLDGGPTTHDAIRGQGVFARVLKNFSGDPRVVVHTVLGRKNFRELEEVARTAAENGFRGVVCGLYGSRPGVDDPDALTDADRAAILEEIRRVRGQYPSLIRMSERMLSWYARPHELRDCYWGRDVLHFDVSWRRQPCLGEGFCARCVCLGGAVGSPVIKLLHPAEIFRSFS